MRGKCAGRAGAESVRADGVPGQRLREVYSGNARAVIPGSVVGKRFREMRGRCAGSVSGHFFGKCFREVFPGGIIGKCWRKVR